MSDTYDETNDTDDLLSPNDQENYEGIHTHPISDGSQVMLHDGYDVQVFHDACAQYPNLAQIVNDASAELSTALALIRDVFFSFYHSNPVAEPIVPLTVPYEINRGIIENMLITNEWRTTREAGTAGDILNSAIATVGAAKKIIDSLSKEMIDQINRLHEMETGADQLFARAETLTDLALQAEGDQARALFDQIKEIRARHAELRTEIENEKSLLDQDAINDTTRRAARNGMVSAEQEIENIANGVRAFGNGGPNDKPITTKDKIEMAQQIGKSKRLQQLAALAGRFERIALQAQYTKVDNPPIEIVNIGLGKDIEHIISAELALLADPALEDMFTLKYVESKLLTYDLQDQEKQGQGPIIASIDTSGSMLEIINNITKDVWAKGVLLGLLAIARKQNRDLVILIYSDGKPQRYDFPKGQGPHQKVMQVCDAFIGAGTRFEPWMEVATTIINESKFNRADIIAISDGLTSINPGVKERFNQSRTMRETHVYGVLIGTDQGAAELASISDAMLTLEQLENDLPTLQQIFSI